jgi:hypothetical protein
MRKPEVWHCYINENFPFQMVQALRILGHDVLTSLEAGNANQSIPDDQVLEYAAQDSRALLTINNVILSASQYKPKPYGHHCLFTGFRGCG